MKEEKVHNHPTVSLIQSTPKPIEFISKIASICYDSTPKSSLSLVNHLYKNGHHSVFEHVYFTFKIEGISRACSHQLVRHRMATFTQRSQRYCSEDDFFPVLAKALDNDKDVMSCLNTIKECYTKLRDKGVANEDARYILPNACDTQIIMSLNLRELMHLANERLCVRAQTEIRELVAEMCKQVDPELQFMLVPKCKSGIYICPTLCENKE